MQSLAAQHIGDEEFQQQGAHYFLPDQDEALGVVLFLRLLMAAHHRRLLTLSIVSAGCFISV